MSADRSGLSEGATGALAGRVAVVTGAATGIGAAIVRAMLAQGALVHGLDRNAAGLQQLAAEPGCHGRLVGYEVNLANRARTDGVLAKVRAAMSDRCDILVNNAGVSHLRSFAQSDDALLDFVLQVNFVAAFRVTRALLPALERSTTPVVVNIASELALVGQAGYSAYCGSKGAVLAWSRALAVELAGAGIRVNAVCPGPIDTGMLAAEFAVSDDPSAARHAERATVPLGRLGNPADIAAVVAFLVSDAASFVTGAAWSVDGGKTSH